MKAIFKLLMLVLAFVAFGSVNQADAQCTAVPYTQNFDSWPTCSTSSSCSVGCTLQQGWTNVNSYTWRVDQGGTSSGATGPSAGHTTGAFNDRYLYIETSGSCNAVPAIAESPCFDIPASPCNTVSFWYHQYGSVQGTLTFQVSTDGGTTWTTLHTSTGNQGNQWNQYSAPLTQSGSDVRFRFMGTDNAGCCAGDMAIDDFELGGASTPANAGFTGLPAAMSTIDPPVALVPNFPGGSFSGTGVVGNSFDPGISGAGSHVVTYTVGCPNAISASQTVNVSACGAIQTLPYFEDFESFPLCAGSCAATCNLINGWANLGSPHWITDQGGTSSGNTGPAVDHTLGNSLGNYLYTETSGSACNNAQAIAQSPCIDLGNANCLSLTFWYHMFGVAQGSMDVEVTTDGGTTWTNIFTTSGNQGNQWNEAVIPLTVTGVVQFRWLGNTGTSFTSDMAIDDVGISSVPLSAVFSGAGTYCTSDAPVDFNAVTGGGTFTISPITNPNPLVGNTFDPSLATPITFYTVTHTVGVPGCTPPFFQQFLVLPPPQLTVGADETFCSQGGTTVLTATSTACNSPGPPANYLDSTAAQQLAVAGGTLNFSFTGGPAPTGPGTLTVLFRGDYSSTFEFLDVIDENSNNLGQAVGPGGPDCNPIPHQATFALSTAQLNLWNANGSIDFLLDASASVSATLCPGNNDIYLKLEYPAGTGGCSIEWNPPGFFYGTPQVHPTVTTTTTTNYVAKVTDAQGCVNTDTTTVTVLPAVPVNAGPDQDICPNTCTDLLGSGGFGGSGGPATQMPLPPQGTTFTGNARGYWFTAPTNFTMTGLRVPNTADTGAQNIQVVRFNAGPPPAFPGLSTAFTTLFYQTGIAGNAITPVSINVGAGDVIGIYGTRGTNNVNSYGTPTGPYVSNIGGFPVTLTRSGTQNPIHLVPGPNWWTETAGAISRTEMYYSTGPIVSTGSSFVWSPGGQTTDSINVCPIDSATTYTLTVTDSALGCTNSDDVTVFIPAPPDASFSGLPDTTCTSEGPFNLTAVNPTYGAIDAFPGVFSGPGVTGNVWDPSGLAAGTHTITYVVGLPGCTETTSQSVVIVPPPIIDAGLDQLVCAGEGANLFATSPDCTNPTPPVLGGQMALPAFSSNYTANQTRGYWFTATTSFTINGIRVPDNNGGPGNVQNVEILRMPAPPSVFPTLTTTFTSLFYAAGAPAAGIIPTGPIQINAGDHIGVLGARGTGTVMLNNYANVPATGFATSIGGGAVTLWRFINQTNLSTPSQVGQIGQTAGASPIANVELYYSVGTPAPGACSIVWSNGAITPATTVNPPAGATTTYTATVTASTGCQASDDVDVTVHEVIPVDAGSDATICQYDCTPLVGTGGYPGSAGGDGNPVNLGGTFGGNNGNTEQGFNVINTSGSDFQINSIDWEFDTGSGTVDIMVQPTGGTTANDGTGAGWIVHESVPGVVANGAGMGTPVVLTTPILIPAGATVGISADWTASTLSASYITGPFGATPWVTPLYVDGNLTITHGVAGGPPGAGLGNFSVRNFPGFITYEGTGPPVPAPDASYVWSPTGETTDSILACPVGSGVFEYVFQVTDDSTQCSNSDTAHVTVIAAPSLPAITVDSVSCFGVCDGAITTAVPGGPWHYFTGVAETIVIPAGVSSVDIEAWGGEGAASVAGTAGAAGGYATGTLAVSAGDVLTVTVGGGGGQQIAGHFNGGGNAGTSACTAAQGGGGGGASDVRLNGVSVNDRILVAAGGGGAGGNRVQGCGPGTGGGAGGGYFGGGGGGAYNGGAGLGGTQAAGGAGGNGNFGGGTGTAGSAGQGGNGGSFANGNNQGGNAAGPTGGNGGGLSGAAGGIGFPLWRGGGGGGGSSYIGGVTAGFTSAGVQSGVGVIAIHGLPDSYGAPSGGGIPPQLTWTGPNGFTSGLNSIDSLCAGIYNLVVTDLTTGCTETAAIEVGEPDLLVVEMCADTQYVAKGYGPESSALITTSVTGGTPNYWYTWTGGNKTGETTDHIYVAPDSTTSYTVDVVDHNGCMATATTVVVVIDVTCCSSKSSKSSIKSGSKSDKPCKVILCETKTPKSGSSGSGSSSNKSLKSSQMPKEKCVSADKVEDLLNPMKSGSNSGSMKAPSKTYRLGPCDFTGSFDNSSCGEPEWFICDCDGGITCLTISHSGGAGQTLIASYGSKSSKMGPSVTDNGDGTYTICAVGSNSSHSSSGSSGNSSKSSSAKPDKLKSNLTLSDGNGNVSTIHTSCSQPINPGDVHGVFEVVSYTDVAGNFCRKQLYEKKLIGGGDFGGSNISEETEVLMPTDAVDFEAYPNPFNTSTTIRFSMPADAHVTLAVYSINGAIVSTLFEGDVTAEKVYKFDYVPDGDTQSGIYFSKLIVRDGEIHHKRLVLTR